MNVFIFVTVDFMINEFAHARYFITFYTHIEWQSNGLKGNEWTIIVKTINIRREKEGKKKKGIVEDGEIKTDCLNTSFVTVEDGRMSQDEVNSK